MGEVGKIVAGAALIAGAVALDVASGGAAGVAGAEEFTAFLAIVGSTGASLVASGAAGLLATPPPGQGITSQNPIKPWDIAYGNVKVGGTFVDIESNGGILSGGSNTYNKCTNFVVMLAAHPIESVDQVRLNGKPIPLTAGGSGALSTTWTYTPSTNQSHTNISSISRASGVVTVVLVAGLSGQNGLQLNVQHVADASFNGVFTVTQPNPADDTTFTYLCGGADTTSSGGYVLTTYPDWKNRVHCDLTSCLGTHTSTFPEFLSTSKLWTAAHKNLGKASVYIAFYYDADVFANGLPEMSFVISGKNDIYDPRTSTYGYTNNAALVIADYLANPVWGYGMQYGTDIPTAQLIAAANICDEAIPLAAGGTEPRYTINMTFSLSRSRGEVLQDMLNACAGRITYQGGQFVIVPGAWVAPFLTLTQANLIGPIEYKPILKLREACNGVKGTYTSPVSNWQSADIPPYAEDATHGYSSDQWLAADQGVRLWKDVSFPATTSTATAQRLAKIELERTRREGRLTLHCDMSAYRAVALDVIEFTYARYGWSGKTFEVLSSQLVVQMDDNGGAPTLGVDLELAETDADVYDWTTSEELTPADGPSPAIDNGQIVSGPQTLVIASGPTTAYVGADGVVIPRILASWISSPDAAVQSGGYVHVEYQKVGDADWTPAGTVTGQQTQCYISNVIDGAQYNVQVQAFRANGGSSGWSQAGPVTVSATSSSFSASNVKYPDGTPVADLQPAQAGADMTLDQTIVYTGLSNNLIPNGTFIKGNLQGWTGAGLTYYAPSPSGLLLLGVGSTVSPTFNTTPGQKYRFSFTGVLGAAGTQDVILRVLYGELYQANIDVGVPGYISGFDFMSSGSIAGTLTTYTYEWTCPSGVYFASLAMVQLGTAQILFSNVSAQDYGVVAQAGADKTSSNISAGFTGQGALATINQANTVNIVAGAVNSQITYSSTVLISIPANTPTIVAQTTITTGGGYVKIRAMMEIFGGSTTAYAYPQIRIFKGSATGTQIAFYGNVFVPQGVVGGGGAVVAIEAVDDSPGLAQQYTVVAYSNTIAMSCESISFVVENAKV